MRLRRMSQDDNYFYFFKEAEKTWWWRWGCYLDRGVSSGLENARNVNDRLNVRVYTGKDGEEEERRGKRKDGGRGESCRTIYYCPSQYQ